MDEAAMGAGICIVLVTVVVAVALPRHRRPLFTPLLATALAAAAPALRMPPTRARASPQWLQRFLN